MDRCAKDEPTAKNLVCKKALPIPEKNGKNRLGVASTPLGHWRGKSAEEENLDRIYFAVDIEKAFDSVDHNFIFTSLGSLVLETTLYSGKGQY